MPTGVFLHKPCSEETKKKISRANKGKVSKLLGRKRPPFSPEWIQKIKDARKKQSGKNEPRLGIPNSPEMRLRISQANRGIKRSEEFKKTVSETLRKMYANGKRRPALLGTKTSDTTRRKISEKLKGDKSYLWRGGITPIN